MNIIKSSNARVNGPFWIRGADSRVTIASTSCARPSPHSS